MSPINNVGVYLSLHSHQMIEMFFEVVVFVCCYYFVFICLIVCLWCCPSLMWVSGGQIQELVPKIIMKKQAHGTKIYHLLSEKQSDSGMWWSRVWYYVNSVFVIPQGEVGLPGPPGLDGEKVIISVVKPIQQ